MNFLHVVKYTLCLKKRGAELLQLTLSLLTDFENFFTVGNRNELSGK